MPIKILTYLVIFRLSICIFIHRPSIQIPISKNIIINPRSNKRNLLRTIPFLFKKPFKSILIRQMKLHQSDNFRNSSIRELRGNLFLYKSPSLLLIQHIIHIFPLANQSRTTFTQILHQTIIQIRTILIRIESNSSNLGTSCNHVRVQTLKFS